MAFPLFGTQSSPLQPSVLIFYLLAPSQVDHLYSINWCHVTPIAIQWHQPDTRWPQHKMSPKNTLFTAKTPLLSKSNKKSNKINKSPRPPLLGQLHCPQNYHKLLLLFRLYNFVILSKPKSH